MIPIGLLVSIIVPISRIGLGLGEKDLYMDKRQGQGHGRPYAR